MELDNVWVLHALKHLQLIIDHLLVAAHILLQDNLDCDLALRAVSFPNDAICPSTQCLSKAVSRSASKLFNKVVAWRGFLEGAYFLS